LRPPFHSSCGKPTSTGQQLVTKLAYLETEGKLVKEEHEFEEAAIAAITETRNHTASEFERQLDADLPDAERKAAGLREDRSPCRFRS
jgi:hypothetical protein